MANPDLMNADVRENLIKEIDNPENKNRKAESLKRFEVYKERQGRYITEKLQEEFSIKTVMEMRKILSINLCPRIINELASIYTSSPERTFGEANDQEKLQLENLYKLAKADVKMLHANRYFKLNDQVLVQVVPRSGKVQLRVILPHQCDVIPDENDPEKIYAVIISVFDKSEYINQSTEPEQLSNPGRSAIRTTEMIDQQNQKIADANDYEQSLKRYEVWTEELNFIMDGNGKVVSGETVENPIGELPFVDISVEKDFEFWIRRGNGIVDFSVDFGSQLSDVANIIRLQGYAQAIVTGPRQPENMIVGPNHVLFMQTDSDRPEAPIPTFTFANPGSDLQSGLEFLEMTLRLFLTSKGIDPKTISGKMDGAKFSSGVERLLSMLDKFQASKADIEQMRWAEEKIFNLMVLWSNYYQGNLEVLEEELQGGKIGEQVTFTIQFKEPEVVQTKAEQEDSFIKLLEKGLSTRKKAIMELYDLDEDQAEEMIAEIDAEKVASFELFAGAGVGPDGKTPIDAPADDKKIEEDEDEKVIQ